MSPFAATVDRRGHPIDARSAEKLERALRESGTARGRRVSTHSGGFWAVAEVESESRARTGPRDDLEGFCLGAGHLDGVFSKNGLRGPDSSGGAAAAIDWQALAGSCALALIGPEGPVLHLARDPLGEETLFFAEAGGRILLADRIETLLRLGAGTRSLDRSQLVRFFGLGSPRPGRTFFEGIEEVEPGTAIRFTSRGRERSRFWNPTTDRPALGRTDAEFANEFRDRLERATADLLGSPGKTGIMLSGGLDSTSLAVVAARQARQAGEEVAACSWLFDELDSCDERSYIERTLALHGFEVIQIPGDECWPLADPELFSNHPGTPEENPFRALKSALYSAARERGRTLLFNGGTVEIFYRGGSLYLRDLLRDGRPVEAGAALFRQLRVDGLRPALGSAARVLRPTGRRRAKREAPVWLTEGAKRWWCEEMDATPPVDRGIRDVVPYLEMEARGFQVENRYSEEQGVRLASPYWTRAWLDFMLALPAHQVYRPGLTKFIAREAMRGSVPESIRKRQAPTLLDPLFHRGLFEREEKLVADLLHGAKAVWREFVEPGRIRGLGPASPAALKLVLWNCASFELWRRKHGWEVG